MQPSIKALRYFLTAARLGSIARAAEQLNVVPSAIANAIEIVEQEFELKLVQRYPAKGIKVTAAGDALIRKIHHLIEEYDNLLLEGTELRSALSGQISIGYYAPVAPAFVPDIVKPLIDENPLVRLKLVECDNERAQTGLLDGEFDLVIFVAENVRAGIEYETLLEAPAYLLVAKDHPLSKRSSITFDDINGLSLVLLDLPFTSEYYRSLIDQFGLDVHVVATATSSEMLRSLVGAGIGCAILNMCPKTDISYGGQKLARVPIVSSARSLKLVVGHLGGNRRRLIIEVENQCRQYFNKLDSKKLTVCA